MAMEISSVTAAMRPSVGATSGVTPGAGPTGVVQTTTNAQEARAFMESMKAAQQRLQSHPVQAALPAGLQPASNVDGPTGIGQRLLNGLSGMSDRLKADHKYVSSLIEKATVGGDDAMLMRALVALGDYQQRVQVVTKTVSKAASSLDQLTRLQ